MIDLAGNLTHELATRYRIQAEVGRGASAVVLRAYDLKRSRTVAIKVLFEELAEGVRRERFLREIEIAGRLNHPHILPLYESGEASGMLYYVMPFVTGQSVRERIARAGVLPIDEVVRITGEAAAALAFAHARGIVHRDIKPENILLEDGKVLVADFGVARALSEPGNQKLTRAGIAVGTPDYMSPEQAAGAHDLDGRTDQYALACVAYEMLAGAPPFSGRTAYEILARHALDPVPRLAAERPGVEDHIESALRKALAKTPSDRFVTTVEFATALATKSSTHTGPGPVTQSPAIHVLVGRNAELQNLSDRFQQARSGQGGTVFVTGEAGAGKSELVQHFLRHVSETAPECKVLTASCSEQFGVDAPYQPFVAAFQELFRDSGRSRRSRLRKLAHDVAPYWAEAVPRKGGFVAAATKAAAHLRKSFASSTVTPPPTSEALFFQYSEAFLSAAGRSPVLLFIDDLHWADKASISLLVHLARKIGQHRVLILGTYRPADVDATNHALKTAQLELDRYGAVHEIALEPLSDEALEEFTRIELGNPASPQLLLWLRRHAGGNPLFLGELLTWVVDNKHVSRTAGEWRLTRPPDDDDVPRTLESVVQRRLARLDPEDYRLLEHASVQGDEFNSLFLARLHGRDETLLEERLADLIRVHKLVKLIDTRELPNGELATQYAFAHSVVQQVMHHELQGKRRVLLHRKMSEILEDVYASDTTVIARKLAIHCHEGRQLERAVGYATAAARLALRVYANWDAIELLERALADAESDEHRVTVYTLLGDANRRVGRFVEAHEAFEQALRHSPQGRDGTAALGLQLQIVWVQRANGDVPPAVLLDRLAELERQAREADATADLCRILWAYRLVPGASDPQSAARAFEALALSQQLGDETLLANARFELGTLLLFSQDSAVAVQHLEEAAALYGRMSDQGRLGHCNNCMAIAHVLAGAWQKSVPRFEAAARAFQLVGDPVNAAAVRNNYGALLVQMGHWESAESNLREAIRIAERMDALARVLHPLENLAELHEQKGDPAAAREHYQRLLELAQETGYWTSEVIARCGLARLMLAEDDIAGAEILADSAGDLLGKDEDWSESRVAWQLLIARIAHARGEPDRARALLEIAETALVTRDRYRATVFRLARAEVLLDIDRATARYLLEETVILFGSFGAEPMRTRAEALLASIER